MAALGRCRHLMGSGETAMTFDKQNHMCILADAHNMFSRSFQYIRTRHFTTAYAFMIRLQFQKNHWILETISKIILNHLTFVLATSLRYEDYTANRMGNRLAMWWRTPLGCSCASTPTRLLRSTAILSTPAGFGNKFVCVCFF